MAIPRLKISILAAILFILGIWFGGAPLLTAGVFAAFLIHEISHLICCYSLGYRVSGLQINLFGGCLEIDPLFEADPGAETLIAAAGPAINFLMAAGVVYLSFLGIDSDYLSYWRQINLLIGGINLLPAYPLDGGRIVHSWLSKHHGFKTAARLSRLITGITAIILIISGLIQLVTSQNGLFFILVGIFIFWQFVFINKPFQSSLWQIHWYKKNRLQKKGFINTKMVMVDARTLLRFPLQHYGTNEYLFFYIQDGQNNYRLIPEEKAWEALFSKGYNTTFKELL